MILEVNLHDFIRKSEHDRMLGLQPLFNVSTGSLSLFGCLFIFLLTRVRLQVGPEMLKQGHFLLEFLRVLCEGVRAHYVLLLRLGDGFPLEIVEVLAIQIKYYLCGVIEENSGSSIGEQVAEAVLG